MNRRQFLKMMGQGGAAALVSGLSLNHYAKYIETEWVTVERVQVPIPRLPTALEGFTIVQMSDFHVDAHTDIEVIRQAVKTANALTPDVIALTGDFISRKVDALADLTPLLSALNAKYGIFAVMGNHEIGSGAQAAQRLLQQAGLSVLVNEGVSLGVGRENVYLAGLDDPWRGKPDLNLTLENRPGNAPTILLAHEPDFADQFTLDGRIDLHLAGHTHGGQVRVPGIGALVLPRYGEKYDQGLYDVGGMWLYTNRGIGLSPVGYRFNCPPEVTELTLVAAK